MVSPSTVLLFTKKTKRKVMRYAAVPRDYRDGDMEIWSLTFRRLTSTIVDVPHR